MNAETLSLICYAVAAACIVCAVVLIRHDIRRQRERAAINRRLDQLLTRQRTETRGQRLQGERDWRNQCQ